MARTAITPTTLTINDATAAVYAAGTVVDAALVTAGVVIEDCPLEELILLVSHTASSEKDLTVAAGDSPPALEAGVGALVEPFAAGNVTPVDKIVGPFTSGRFIQSGADAGSLFVDFEAGFTGFIRAFRVPRTA